MTDDELRRMREWCHERIDKMTNPRVLAEFVKLCDAAVVLEAGVRPLESDPEMRELVERIAGGGHG
jgi:hypothetical protein